METPSQAGVTMTYYRAFLRNELSQRIERNPRFSLRAFARFLQVNFGGLSNILAGKQTMTLKMGLQVADRLDLSPEERASFIGSIVAEQKGRPLKRRDPRIRKGTYAQELPARTLDIELYRSIADWYHGAILVMTDLPDFKNDPAWLARSLGIEPSQAKAAVQRLLALEMLEEKGGRLVRRESYYSTSDKHLTNSALKRKQKQIRELAIRSIELDPIETRSMTTVTMLIDPNLLPEARKKISEFNQSLCKFLESGNRTQAYVMEVGLFALQKKDMKEKETL